MSRPESKSNIIRITPKTPDALALSSLCRMFFKHVFSLTNRQFLEIEFTNRDVDAPAIESPEVIVSHRTIDPLLKVRTAFRAAWARMNANQCLVIRFELRPIYFGEDEE